MGLQLDLSRYSSRAATATARRLASRAFLTVTALLLAGLVILFLDVHSGRGVVFIDWWVYALASERFLAGESLYLDVQLAGPYSLRELTPFVYPPPSAILFLPFASWPVGQVAWIIASLAIFLSGLAAIVHRELGHVTPVVAGCILVALTLFVPLPDGRLLAPFLDAVGTANMNLALAGLLAWTWAAGERLRWLPWMAGVLAILKVFPASLILWAVRRNGWRPLLIGLGTAALIVVATLPILGIEEWRRFAVALSNAELACDGGRVSLPCLAEPLLGASGAKLAGLATGALLLVSSVLAHGEYRAFALLTLGMMAGIPDLSQHYYLFLYVLIAIALARLIARRRGGPAEPWRHSSRPEGAAQ
jgi:hypothetical protein